MNLDLIDTIYLKDIDKVKLMNRVDTKYWFHTNALPKILDWAREFYYVLEINEKKVLSYSTTYYDTALNSMYIAHHNGKLNRFKIRHRTYLESGISFLEIKKKSNKGRTVKSRIPSSADVENFTNEEALFLDENCPFTSDELSPSIQNRFSRITLVSKNLDERCTIDMDLHFYTDKQVLELDKLAIIEIKTDGLPSSSPLREYLLKMGIKKSGFSKYCIGRAMSSSNIKNNSFKHTIRKVNKTLCTPA
ncbi:polyphosphate polymerase domain-containing protein [Saccharicrinis aurantiacus]|uniref:polyphosphate polymerase domain-containing protein n=1 Tax=Saccharicrinis aurantiacus TaxID=1849719 RepID=UPI0008398540|nr:polyphosphate polymerase domain-containing protein [Saccharicrinis aurantiacus]